MPPQGSSTTYPVGSGQRMTIDQIQAKYLDNLDPQFAQRLRNLMVASGGSVGIEEGFRSGATQQQGFLSRYTPSGSSGDVQWQGQWYTKKPGVLPMAPPGSSYHEIGLAVDLTGDLNFARTHGAEFGVSATVGNDPPHFQPIELPTARAQYNPDTMGLGATWTSGPSGNGNGVSTPTTNSDGSTGATGANQGTSAFGAAAAPPTGPIKLPPDAKVYTADGKIIALFNVHGVNISYNIPYDGSVDYGNIPVQQISSQQWADLNAVPGGDAQALENVTHDYGSYSKSFDAIIGQVMGPHNPAANDPEVMKVMAEFAGRANMSTDELKQKLQATNWYNTHTQGQLNWDHTSDAEKQTQRDDKAAQMADTWFTFTGQRIAADDPRITNYLEDVASGKIGMGAWTESVVKKQAAQDPNSTYSRETEAQLEAQKARGIEIENTAQNVRDLAKRWGIQWAPGTYQDWATNITSKNASEADLVNELQKQAQVLYPWKSPTVETQTAAQPWVQTYNRVMEKNGDIFDPKIQQALTSGAPTWQFEQNLKQSSDWLQTKNAATDMTTAMSDVGKLMGYN